MCKIGSYWEAAIYHREFTSRLYDDLEWWDEGGGREGIYVYLWQIHTAVGGNQHNIVKQFSSN